MVIHAVEKQDSSKWQSIAKVSLLRNNDKSINTICTLPDYSYAQEIPFVTAFFDLFIFDVFTSKVLYTLKTHYRLTFSVHKQIHTKIEI